MLVCALLAGAAFELRVAVGAGALPHEAESVAANRTDATKGFCISRDSVIKVACRTMIHRNARRSHTTSAGVFASPDARSLAGVALDALVVGRRGLELAQLGGLV